MNTSEEIMKLQPTEKQDVWQRLKNTEKPIVMYGMGNGADKILAVMEAYGIEVADFFASDGFVRGHTFHGKRVLSFQEVCEKYEDMLVVISFASTLPDVLERFYQIAERYETVAPDVPVSGDTLFTLAYYREHAAEFEQAYNLLADEESKKIFQNIVEYKISGKIGYLEKAVSCEDRVMEEIVCPQNIRTYVDLGAYNGDTIRRLLDKAENLERVYAMEPDARNFRKLQKYAEEEKRVSVHAYPYAAWNKREELIFRVQGNRNSTISQNGTTGIAVSQSKEKTILAESVDAILAGNAADYIKYDVEGAEQQALEGSAETIRSYMPKLLVSLYHRSEDLFKLPLLIRDITPDYRFYLRRFSYVPAWDINLYCVPKSEFLQQT